MPRKTSRFHLREGRGILERLRAAETMLLPQVLVGGTPGMTPQDQPLVTAYHRRHQAKCWPRVALDHGYMILQRLLTTDCNKNRSGKLEKKNILKFPNFLACFFQPQWFFRLAPFTSKFSQLSRGRPSCSEATAGHLILSD